MRLKGCHRSHRCSQKWRVYECVDRLFCSPQGRQKTQRFCNIYDGKGCHRSHRCSQKWRVHECVDRLFLFTTKTQKTQRFCNICDEKVATDVTDVHRIDSCIATYKGPNYSSFNFHPCESVPSVAKAASYVSPSHKIQ
jgi:hypothetical protein